MFLKILIDVKLYKYELQYLTLPKVSLFQLLGEIMTIRLTCLIQKSTLHIYLLS